MFFILYSNCIFIKIVFKWNTTQSGIWHHLLNTICHIFNLFYFYLILSRSTVRCWGHIFNKYLSKSLAPTKKCKLPHYQKYSQSKCILPLKNYFPVLTVQWLTHPLYIYQGNFNCNFKNYKLRNLVDPVILTTKMILKPYTSSCLLYTSRCV